MLFWVLGILIFEALSLWSLKLSNKIQGKTVSQKYCYFYLASRWDEWRLIQIALFILTSSFIKLTSDYGEALVSNKSPTVFRKLPNGQFFSFSSIYHWKGYILEGPCWRGISSVVTCAGVSDTFLVLYCNKCFCFLIFLDILFLASYPWPLATHCMNGILQLSLWTSVCLDLFSWFSKYNIQIPPAVS